MGHSKINPAPGIPTQRLRRRRWLKAVVFVLAMAFVAMNTVAYLHARSMTHFVTAGARTASPKELSRFNKLKVLLSGVNIPKPVNHRTPNRSFATHSIATRDGQTLEAWRIPVEPSQGTIICFHGYTSCKSALIEMADAFAEMGYDTLLVDFRGCGGSSGNETSLGCKEAIDVTATVDFARTRSPGKPIILFGESLGAAAVLRAVAVEGARADAIIVEQPFNSLRATTAHRFALMGLPAFPLTELLLFWGSVQQGFWAFNMNPQDFARSVTCPTLLIRADGDAYIRPEESQSVYDNLEGPKLLVTVHTTYHDAMRKRDAKTWDAAVESFLRSLR